jgi:hypothetical protein
MLSILALSSVVSAGQTYNDILALSNDSEVYKSGYYTFATDLENILKMFFCLLIAAIMSFISILSIRSFAHCKRV